MIKFSEGLKILRNEHNLTKTKMAQIANVSLKTYLKWENGYTCIKSKN